MVQSIFIRGIFSSSSMFILRISCLKLFSFNFNSFVPLSKPVKLYEARTKEWNELDGCTQAIVNRDVIAEDILRLYGQDDDITSTTLQVSFLNEPAEDADGLMGELFSQGWNRLRGDFQQRPGK